jgi:hypothetical protein
MDKTNRDLVFSLLCLLNIDRLRRFMSRMCNRTTVIATWQRITTYMIVNGEQVEIL